MRYFAQLVCEEKPYIKAKNIPKKGIGGLDVGPTKAGICFNRLKSPLTSLALILTAQQP